MSGAGGEAAPAPPVTVRVLYLCLQQLRQGQAAHAHVFEIIRGIERRGLAVRLIAAYPENETPPASPLRRVWRMLRVQVQAIAALRRCDAVYLRYHVLALPLCLAARLARRPLVVEINGAFDDLYASYPEARWLRWPMDLLGTLVVRCGTAAIAVTAELGEWVRRLGFRGLVRLIPNGANTELFRPGPPEGGAAGVPYVIFFGALARWQGIELMLEATRHPAWPTGVRLVIAGDGVMRRAVEDAMRSSTAVDYLGTVPHRELPVRVRGAIAGLVVKGGQPGLKFGLAPLKLYETLACGVPAIVTDWPGQADLVRAGECGIVIARDDAAACAAAVATLADNPALARALGARGAVLVKAQHSWDARARDTVAVLHSLVRRPGGSGA